jgi:hypothetical protein
MGVLQSAASKGEVGSEQQEASKQKQRRAVGTAYRRLAKLVRDKDPSFPGGAFPCELVEVEQGEADDGTRAHKWLCKRCIAHMPVPAPTPAPAAPCCTMSKKCTIS